MFCYWQELMSEIGSPGQTAEQFNTMTQKQAVPKRILIVSKARLNLTTRTNQTSRWESQEPPAASATRPDDLCGIHHTLTSSPHLALTDKNRHHHRYAYSTSDSTNASMPPHLKKALSCMEPRGKNNRALPREIFQLLNRRTT